jgi:uncharacterized protein
MSSFDQKWDFPEDFLGQVPSLRLRRKRMLRGLRTFWRGRNAFFALLSWKISGKRRPVRVSLLVTKKCNLRCFYCYALDEITDPTILDASFDKLTALIDELYDAGCRWINILGGEPLARADIGDIIDYIIKKGMLAELTTNGYYIRKRINALKKLDHLAISLDGNKDANDRARLDVRGNGSFEHIIEGLKCAAEEGLNVRIHATLNKRTMASDSLDFLAGLCKKYGMTFNYSENGLPGIEDMDPDYLLAEDETMNFYRQYDSLKKKGYPIVSSKIAVEYAAKWPLKSKTTIYKSDVENVPKNSYFDCTLGRNQCFVTADGKVYSCSKRWGIGENAYKIGFKAAWKKLENLDCVACKELGTIEQSLITALQPRGFVNGVLNFVLR